MSSRALRKLTEKAENHPGLQGTSEESGEDVPSSPFVSKFSALKIADDETVCSHSDSEQNVASQTAPSKSRRKPKKKAKKKHQISSPDLDVPSDISEVPTTSMDPSNNVSLTELLSVNAKSLDPFKELSRLFGSHIVGGPRVVKKTDRRSNVKRGLLVRIKPSWPPVTRFGLDMIHAENGEFTFIHSKEYANTQKSFYVALETMDPNNLVEILTNCPYHIDSLLQLSEIMMHQDNSEVAIDLLERALHAFQSAFHTSFNPAAGIFHLDYRKQENRGLFVTLFRYIDAIGTRGCYRNALEYSKILLSLDVEDDPLAVLLMIDHYALLADQFDFLLRFYDLLNPRRNLYLLPNFAYSLPLALFLKSQLDSQGSRTDRSEADAKLQDALLKFPGFVTRLLKRTTLGGVTNLDKSVLFGKEIHTESESLARLLDLYVVRTHALWTSPDVSSWLEQNIATVLSLVEPPSSTNSGSAVRPDNRLAEYSKMRQSLYPALPRNVLRHLVLSNLPEAPPLFPRGANMPHIYNFDPLPPQDAINYSDPNEERDRSRTGGRDGGFLYSLFTSLLPDDSLQQAVQQFVQRTTETDTAGPDGAGGSQPLGLAAERLAASLRRVLEHIDPRRAWSTTPADGNPERNQDEPGPEE